MKRIPIDECPAGPEIDAAVAKSAGWIKSVDGSTAGWWLYPDGYPYEHQYYRPSTDIAIAWKLTEEEDLFADQYLTKDEDGNYAICPKYTGFGEWPEYYQGNSSSIALTITRTYLKAKGVEFVEVEE